MSSKRRDVRIGQRDAAERAYQSLWHLAVAGVGIYEYRNQKSTLAKVLSVGLIAFHLDGAIADFTDTRPLSRRVLNYIVGVDDDDKPNPRHRLPEKSRRKER